MRTCFGTCITPIVPAIVPASEIDATSPSSRAAISASSTVPTSRHVSLFTDKTSEISRIPTALSGVQDPHLDWAVIQRKIGLSRIVVRYMTVSCAKFQSSSILIERPPTNAACAGGCSTDSGLSLSDRQSTTNGLCSEESLAA